MTALEAALKRRLTATDKAVIAACPGLQSLALICIQEGVTPKAARRIHRLLAGLLDVQAKRAAHCVAAMVGSLPAGMGN